MGGVGRWVGWVGGLVGWGGGKEDVLVRKLANLKPCIE